MQSDTRRFAWVDAAKGLCIVLVVLMHATLGVEKAASASAWLHAFIDWARPFRMPDFFLISGLFLAARIERPWRAYLDTKVLHFAYFYVLWLTIQFWMKSPRMIAADGLADTLAAYALSFIEPFGTLWFIYLLAIFFVAAKLLHPVPRGTTLAAAALLHLLAPKTGSLLVDEFTDRFVFFYSGYALAPVVFAYARHVAASVGARTLACALALWCIANAAAVETGAAALPGADLAVSYAGIAAIIAFAVFLSRTGWERALACCGRNSIAIYLAFTLFMGPARVLLLEVLGGHALDLVALASTAAGVIGSLALARAVGGTRLAFLFTRPQAFRLAPAHETGGPGLAPALSPRPAR
jgi:uncharacterized membrane protein YcfT